MRLTQQHLEAHLWGRRQYPARQWLVANGHRLTVDLADLMLPRS